jgi:hypothetical protein
MAHPFFSGLFSWIPPSRPLARRQAVRRPRSSVLQVEVLEDRLTPSGGHGGKALVARPHHTSGKISRGAPARVFKLDDTAPPLAPNVLLSELFSGYPLPPSVGPALQNDTLVLSNPSAWPFSQQNSPVAVVPVMLVGGSSMGTGPSSYTLVLLDPVTGFTYSVPVTAVPPPAGGI